MRRREKYRPYKAGSCAWCGFVPVDRCQLDVDHIDGNHANNALDNLWTLCANCHRVKTRGPKASEIWSFNPEHCKVWVLVHTVDGMQVELEVIDCPDRQRAMLYGREWVSLEMFFAYYHCRPESIVARRRFAERCA